MILLKNKKAYTLAELLIVLTIIGIIIVLILPSLFGNKDGNVIDNTRPTTKVNSKMSFGENDCKVQTIEITDKGVSIRCKEY